MRRPGALDACPFSRVGGAGVGGARSFGGVGGGHADADINGGLSDGPNDDPNGGLCGKGRAAGVEYGSIREYGPIRRHDQIRVAARHRPARRQRPHPALRAVPDSRRLRHPRRARSDLRRVPHGTRHALAGAGRQGPTGPLHGTGPAAAEPGSFRLGGRIPSRDHAVGRLRKFINNAIPNTIPCRRRIFRYGSQV